MESLFGVSLSDEAGNGPVCRLSNTAAPKVTHAQNRTSTNVRFQTTGTVPLRFNALLPSSYTRELFSNLSSIALKAIPSEHIIGKR